MPSLIDEDFSRTDAVEKIAFEYFLERMNSHDISLTTSGGIALLIINSSKLITYFIEQRKFTKNHLSTLATGDPLPPDASHWFTSWLGRGWKTENSSSNGIHFRNSSRCPLRNLRHLITLRSWSSSLSKDCSLQLGWLIVFVAHAWKSSPTLAAINALIKTWL